MNKGREEKSKGYLIIEIIISLFLFSILVFVISIFLKRVVIVENIKKNEQIQDENLYYVADNIENIIKNRDRNNFYYNGENKNIFISEKTVIFKKDNMFYKLEIKNNELSISDGNDIKNMGSRTILSKYDKINFNKIDKLLLFNMTINNVENIKIINLGNEN